MTTLEDIGPGSLRQSIIEANSQGGGTIIFSNLTGVITLASELPQVAASTGILGPGTNILTISGSNQFRVFEFGPGTTSTVAGLKISDGRLTNGTHGAGILNHGVLTISNCLLLNNQTLGGRGGAIHSSGNLTVQDSLISSNRAVGKDGRGIESPPGTGAGGGISIESGKAMILGCSISLNVASGGRGDFPRKGGDATGGGVFVADGEMTILKCNLNFNLAVGGPGWYGSIFAPPPQVGGGRGGGIFVGGGQVAVTDSILTANSSTGGGSGDAFGAGIHVQSGFVEITGITLSGNRCDGGEGPSTDRGSGGYGGFGRGGGLSAGGGVVNVTNSTISGNQARGGDGGDGAPYRGLPGVGGRGGDGIGGGIFAGGGDLRLVNCTLTRNQASGGFSGFTSGRYDLTQDGTGSGGGAASAGTTPRLLNSILAANLADQGPDGYGVFVSEGFNLIGSDNGMTINTVSTTDFRNLDPLLGPLQDNGGQTPTHALPANSVAIDAGLSLGAPAFDQRGILRPQGAAADIGAFERVTQPTGGSPIIATLSPSHAVLAGSDVSLSVSISGNSPFAFQWQKNGQPIEGATNAVLELLKTQPTDAGSYRVGVSDVQSAATSAEIIMEVKPFFIEPDYQWVRTSQGDDSPYDSHYVSGITVDPAGNLCAVGSFSSRVQFGNTILTNSGGNSDLFILKYDRSGTLQWARRADGSANAVACDAAGNLYVTGAFSQGIPFGSVSSSGSSDVFIAKLSPNGGPIWVRSAGGSSYDGGSGIAVDAAGNSVVAGSFSTNASFGSRTLRSSGERDAFIAKYDSQGVVQWARRAGGVNCWTDGGRVAMDEMGNSYVEGKFYGTAEFDPGVTLTHTNGTFLASYDAQGLLRWVIQPVVAQVEAFLSAVASDQMGHIYVAGNFHGEVTVGTNALTSAGSSDMLLAKYDSTGLLLWVHSAGGTEADYWTDLVVDREGSCYVSGLFSASSGPSLNLGTTLTSIGSSDLVAAKFGADGTLRWITSGGGKGGDSSRGIAVNNYGEVYLAGNFSRHATFGPHLVHGNPSGNIVLAKLALQPRLDVVADSFGASQPFRLLLDGEADVPYVIEKSDFLPNWSALLTITNTAGRTEIIDSSSANLNHRFYRAVTAP